MKKTASRPEFMTEGEAGTGRPEGEGSARKPPFSEFLKVLAAKTGFGRADELQHFLLGMDCHCTRANVALWLDGAEEPTFEKTRDIIKAFHNALPDLEVWEQYKRFLKGEAYLQDKPHNPSQIEESLQRFLAESGLPPALEE